MAAGRHGIDCGLIAPVAPMAPSPIASVGIPSVSRAIDGQLREVATSGLDRKFGDCRTIITAPSDRVVKEKPSRVVMGCSASTNLLFP